MLLLLNYTNDANAMNPPSPFPLPQGRGKGEGGNSLSFVLFGFLIIELINDLSFLDHPQLLPSNFLDIASIGLETFYLFPQFLIFLFQFCIFLLDPSRLLLDAEEAEDPLFPKEGEYSENQKKDEDKKEDTLFSHFLFFV